jgi:endonuclease/exonuclease/phosphatase family metal-dependent hydrolase
VRLGGVVAAIVLTLTTQNVRVGLPPWQAHHDIRQAAHQSSVVVAQEMQHRHAAAYAPAGWGTAHRPGRARGDCATYWNRAVWVRVGRPYTVRLTAAPFRWGTRYALVTILRHRGGPTLVGVVCVHMVTRSWERRTVYARGMDRLDRLLGRLPARTVVAGDWNRGYGRRVPVPGYSTARPPRPTGAGARIDYAWWEHAHLDRIRTIGGTYSDHDGVRVRLRLTP